jgi:hypothetical protein
MYHEMTADVGRGPTPSSLCGCYWDGPAVLSGFYLLEEEATALWREPTVKLQ